MRSRVSTATATSGRSSESVSSRSVRRCCLAPKPSTPRITTLVASPWRGEDVAQRVGEEAIAGAVALAEVDGELERRRRSQRASELAAEPGDGDARDEADRAGSPTPRRSSPSSASRWLSSIQVLNVV